MANAEIRLHRIWPSSIIFCGSPCLPAAIRLSYRSSTGKGSSMMEHLTLEWLCIFGFRRADRQDYIDVK
jgi:hypothetical protein